MPLKEVSEETFISKIELMPESGHVVIQRCTVLVVDGVRIGEGVVHRESLDPGVEVEAQPETVKAVAALVWTPEVVEAHRARVQAADASIRAALSIKG